MNFKNWVKSIQTAGYIGASTIVTYVSTCNYGIRGENLDVKFNGGALIIPKDQLKTAT